MVKKSIKKQTKPLNVLYAGRKKAKMPKKEGNSESKDKQPRLIIKYERLKIAGWIALTLIAFFIVFSVLESGVLFPNTWSWEYRQISNARLGLVGQHICNYYQYDEVYDIKIIKDAYYSVTCMRIRNGNFTMRDYEIWKKDVEALGIEDKG